MNIKLEPKYEELRKEVRDFAETEVRPMAFYNDQNNHFPEEIIKKMGEKGWMGIYFPKEYGGYGGDTMHYAVLCEEISRVDAGVGTIFSAHCSLCAWPIYKFGTEEQKKKYLTPLASGEKLGAFGLTEPEAGSDAGGTQTTAVLEGDHYVINGSKIFITNAPVADTYVVFAVTEPGIGTKGISAFIMEKGMKGFTFGEKFDKMGIRVSSTAELYFDNVKVPKENLLGEEGQGFKIAMAVLDGGRIGLGGQGTGIAQGCLELAIEYAKERKQFDKPIAYQQAIQFKLAEMATNIRCARLLTYTSARLKDEGVRFGQEAAMTKLFASDIAVKAANEAMQIFGGAGYMKGMDIERMYRDAKITTIYEGTNEIQKLVIAGYLLGGVPKKK